MEVFNLNAMEALRERLSDARWRARVLALRIGGNDLLNLMALRRPRGTTIYATPIRLAIEQLMLIFRPHGFRLCGPVFECFQDNRTLIREVAQDLALGLACKAAIHPKQVPIIERQYQVSRRDLVAAERVIAADAAAVFGCDGAMCEPAVHRRWAEDVMIRAKVYGVSEYAECRVGSEFNGEWGS